GAEAVKLTVTVAPDAASTGPASNVTPGISNRSVRVPGRALVTLSVTWSPSLITGFSGVPGPRPRVGPGRVAVAVLQSPGVVGTPKPQIGTEVGPGSVSVPVVAQ